MNCIFECSTGYLTCSLRSLVRYPVEQKKIKFISTSKHVIFCLLYKHTNNDVFDDFPKISDHFPKISEDFPKLFRRLNKRLRTFFRTFSEDCWRFPKVAEDFWGGTDDVSIIQHHLWVLFEQLCSYMYSNGNLKSCDDNLLFSRVKISCYLHVWRYHVYVRKLTLHFTGVYIINVIILLHDSGSQRVINQSKCFIAGPIFSKCWTGHCPEWT